MFSDGVLALEQAGALDFSIPVTASFAFGSAELYSWIDRNPRIRMLRTEKTNDPAVIARQPTMVSGQRCSPGRPVRPGERGASSRHDLFRVRRAD
jgi:hypothetical protein